MSRAALARAFVITVVLLGAASCNDSESPWARSMPKAERAAWVTRCGIPASEVTTIDDKARTNYVEHRGETRPATGPTRIACELMWDRPKNRLASLHVSVAWLDSPMDERQIATLLELVLREVRPEDRAAVRAIANTTGTNFTSGRAGPLNVTGGRDTSTGIWELSVLAR